MGLIKILYRSAFALAISTGIARAQSIELGAGVNHLSNGFHLMYQLPSSSRWTVSAGLRIMVNTYSLNKNPENRIYYQNGYASRFWEHLGLTGKVRYKIAECHNIGLEAVGSILLTWHSLKRRSTDVWDIVLRRPVDDIVYTKPGLALEAIIGPGLYYNISKRWRITATSGLGVCLMNYHRREKQSLVTGKPVVSHRATNYDGPYDIEYVGLGGGLPMIYFGVAYKL